MVTTSQTWRGRREAGATAAVGWAGLVRVADAEHCSGSHFTEQQSEPLLCSNLTTTVQPSHWPWTCPSRPLPFLPWPPTTHTVLPLAAHQVSRSPPGLPCTCSLPGPCLLSCSHSHTHQPGALPRSPAMNYYRDTSPAILTFPISVDRPALGARGPLN